MSKRVGGNRELHRSDHSRFSDSFTAFIPSQLCSSPLPHGAQLSYGRGSTSFQAVVAFWRRHISGLREHGKEQDLPRALAESESKALPDRALGLT